MSPPMKRPAITQGSLSAKTLPTFSSFSPRMYSSKRISAARPAEPIA